MKKVILFKMLVQLPTLLFLLILNINIKAQERLFVEEWVNPPTAQDMEKPLIIIDFWATWCIPCIQAMTETERLMENYHKNVLLVYTSEEPSLTVTKFMEKMNKNFYSSVDTKGRNIDLFSISSIPSTIILGPYGEIVWRGYPTDLDSNILNGLLRKYRGKTGSEFRFSVDAPKKDLQKEVFQDYKAKGVEIEFTQSNAESNFLEHLQPNFYFNGKLENLVSFLYDIPQKNVENLSSNQSYYTLKCTYDDPKKFKKAIEKFIKNKLKIEIDANADLKETYVLKPGTSQNFFDTSTYDFSENQAKYLASDMDVEIDNASVGDMVKILNNFSDLNFDSEGFDNTVYDWSIHFKYDQFTLEQLENDYAFKVEKDQRLVQHIKIKDNEKSPKTIDVSDFLK